MARGTHYPINKAMIRPVLIAGVEKRLAVMNVLFSFALVAATRFHFPAVFVGFGFYIACHFLLRFISKADPHIATLFKRSTRYIHRPFFSGGQSSHDACSLAH